MSLKMHGFGLTNYRSFGDKGFTVSDIKQVNVFIGKNNSGKSNILRAIQTLAQLKHPRDGGNYFNRLENGHDNLSSEQEVRGLLSVEQLLQAGEFSEYDQERLRENAPGLFEVCWGPFPGRSANVPALQHLDLLFLDRVMRAVANQGFNQPQSSKAPYLNHIGNKLLELFFESLKQDFSGLISVPVFREIRHGGTPDESGHVFAGIDIIDTLREMQKPNYGDDEKEQVFLKIQDFTRELFGLKDLALIIPAKENRVLVNMHGRRLPLDNYGTGVHHLVLLCTALAMHSNKVVTIEEPEIHLHPELQRKFLRFLAEKTTNTYFITTHSNVFIDTLPDAAIFHVRYDGKETTVERASTPATARVILADMGYKASDLLQANGVIWVEGPSDRAYLNKWLSLVMPGLVEGIHYAIAFYGGKVLAHFSATDDPVDDLVEVLRINQNAVVMMDRDGDDETQQLTKHKDRIIRELKDGFAWVTNGREVENYLPGKLINKYLTAKFDGTPAFKWSKDKEFHAAINKYVKSLGKPGLRYEKNKVGYARQFCEHMTTDDLDVLDLREKLTELVRYISRWNHIDVPV